MRDLLREMLRALGVRDIQEAEDGSEAFAMMCERTPDIVLVDWEMQPLNGLDFIKLVRTSDDSPNKYTPLIMVTAHSEQQKVFEARDAGINEILIKPVSAETLYGRIKAIVERPRQYIESKDYFGPDRRRRMDPHYPGVERREEYKDTVYFDEG
ncbi:MAG: response regulator [Rhodospirillales bacterium]|nr:response regulator [Rhodospirillales bacterium]